MIRCRQAECDAGTGFRSRVYRLGRVVAVGLVATLVFSGIHSSKLFSARESAIFEQNGAISRMPPQPGKFPDGTGESASDGSQKEPSVLKPSASADASIQRMSAPELVPAAGSVEKVLVIPIEFTDVKFSAGRNQAYFASMLAQMKDYYEKNSGYAANSHGISLDVTVAPIMESSFTQGYYGADTYDIDTGEGVTPQAIHALAREAVEKLTPSMDLSGFDGPDADRVIDHLFILHAGRGQEEAGAESTAIWSHAWDIDPAVTSGAVTAVSYVMVPETGTMGVYAHEFGHDLGLPDLYDTNYGMDGSTAAVGYWDLMGSGSWNTAGGLPAGSVPANLSAWCRVDLGWTTAENVLADGPQTLVNSTGYGNVLRLSTNGALNTGEYWLAEYRRKIGFDAGLPGEGVLIWHVDEDWVATHRAENLINCSPTGRQGIELEQADGAYEMRTGWSYGDSLDPYPGTGANPNFTYFPWKLDLSNLAPSSYTYVDAGNITAGGSTATLVVSVTTGSPVSAPPVTGPVSGAAVGARPVFSWGYTPKATSFRLQWSLDADFTTKSEFLLDPATTGMSYSGGIYSFQPAASAALATYGQPYYWRIAAENPMSTAGNLVFSPVRTLLLNRVDPVSFSFSGAQAGRLMNATTDMEYSTNGGTVWTDVPVADYALPSLSSLTSVNDLRIRLKGDASTVKVFNLLAGPAAPAVSVDYRTGLASGLTTAMEFIADSGTTWTAFTLPSNLPFLTRDVSLKVRVAAAELTFAGTEVGFAYSNLPPAAPASVRFSFDGTDAGKLKNAAAGMEFSLNGGTAWTAIASANPLLSSGQLATLSADADISVRVAEAATVTAGSITVIDILAGPAAPAVSGDDTANTVTGMTVAMETSTDGTTWTRYAGSLPSLAGTVSLRIRVAATGVTLPGAVTTISFTPPYVPPVDPPAVIPPAAPPPAPAAPPPAVLPPVVTEVFPEAGLKVDETMLAPALGSSAPSTVTLAVAKDAPDQSMVIAESLLQSVGSGGNLLRMETDAAAITFSPSMLGLDAIPAGAAVLGSPAAKRYMKMSAAFMNEGEIAAASGALEQMPGSTLKPVGGLFLSLNAALQDGSVRTPLISFSGNLSVGIPIPAEAMIGRDPEKMGVYWHDPTANAWLYAGGLYDERTRTMTFFTSHFSEFAVLRSDAGFPDLAGHWAKADVERMAAKQIAKGTGVISGAAVFSPNREITRAEFTSLLIRTLGLLPETAQRKDLSASSVSSLFSDIPVGKWYVAEMQKAFDLHLIRIGDGRAFRPDVPVTREEMAVLMARAMEARGVLPELKDAKGILAKYPDAAAISAGAATPVAIAVQTTLIQGRAGVASNGKPVLRLAPAGHAMRAEAVTVLFRLLKLLQGT